MFDRFIKLLYFLSWYFVGMATFSYATWLSDLLEDDNLLQVCELGEKVLKSFNHDLKKLEDWVGRCEIKFYLGQFLYHNDRDFLDCCRIFYLIKIFKNIPLTKEVESRAAASFIVGLNCLNDLINLFHISMTRYDLTEEEHNFLASLDYNELIRKIRTSRKDTPQQSSEPADIVQPKSTKTSCSLL